MYCVKRERVEAVTMIAGLFVRLGLWLKQT